MNKKIAGGLIFALLSVLFWGLAAWLLGRSDEAQIFYTLGLAAGFAAIILTMHTVLYMLYADRKALSGDWYRQHGKLVTAEIIKISRRGHRTAWRIKARHVDSQNGQTMLFKSDILRSNPAPKLGIGDPIMVYLHPTDSRRYWMDVGINSEYL
jgi:hypothetical protein